MRPLLATSAILLIAGCASSPEPTQDRKHSVSDGRFTSGSGDAPVAGHGPWNLDASQEFAPDPAEPFIIDFVNKNLRPGFNPVPGLEAMPFGSGMFGPWDTGEGSWARRGSVRLHTMLHLLALRAEVQIIVEGDLDAKLGFIPAGWMDPNEEVPKALALARIQSICKANKLDYIQDGDVVIIKARPAELSLAHVLPSELEGRFDVGFEDHEVVAAIMEVATVTRTQVFVPAVRENETGQLELVKVSLFMRAALPERILGRLAELGGMEIERVTLEDSVDGPSIGYKFKYPE